VREKGRKKERRRIRNNGICLFAKIKEKKVGAHAMLQGHAPLRSEDGPLPILLV
jgi:hypothetical protein